MEARPKCKYSGGDPAEVQEFKALRCRDATTPTVLQSIKETLLDVTLYSSHLKPLLLNLQDSQPNLLSTDHIIKPLITAINPIPNPQHQLIVPKSRYVSLPPPLTPKLPLEPNPQHLSPFCRPIPPLEH